MGEKITGASDTLLQLIAHLQRGVEVAHGQRILLEYVHRSSGARLALLFLLDEERQIAQVGSSERAPTAVQGSLGSRKTKMP